MDRRTLLRIGIVVLVVGFVVLIGKVAILGFTRGAHDTSQVKRAEMEAAGVAAKAAGPSTAPPK
jgi:hypothetical protein